MKRENTDEGGHKGLHSGQNSGLAGLCPAQALRIEQIGQDAAQDAYAKTAQDAADGMKTEYEGKLAAAQGEGEEIIARAKAEAKEQSEKLLAATDAELEQKRRRAEETMAVERANALRDMKSEIATLVIDAAAKAVGDRNTEQQDRMLYDKFIAEAGEAHGGKIQ